MTRHDIEQARFSLLTELLLGRFEEFCDELKVPIYRCGRIYFGPCPIHGGDNPGALNVYSEGEVPGKWCCYTRGCESVFKKTLPGWVRGVLSAQRLGWEPGCPDRVFPFPATLDYCCAFLGLRWRDLQVDSAEVAKERLARLVSSWGEVALQSVHQGLSPHEIRQKLVIPSPYFLTRGYSAEVLSRFDVGDCLSEGKRFSGRAVVPVYQKDLAVGYTARSVHPECPSCQLHHPLNSPCPLSFSDKVKYAKWLHQIASAHYLYNGDVLGKVRGGDLILVEGPGCLWRLVEAGLENVCATFGAKLTDPQQVLIEGAGVRNVWVAYDADQAGERGFEEMQRRLGRLCKVRRLSSPRHDWGEVPVELVRESLVREGFPWPS